MHSLFRGCRCKLKLLSSPSGADRLTAASDGGSSGCATSLPMVTLTPCSTSPSAPSPQKQEELGPAPCFPKLHSLLNDDLTLAEPGDLAAPRGVASARPTPGYRSPARTWCPWKRPCPRRTPRSPRRRPRHGRTPRQARSPAGSRSRRCSSSPALAALEGGTGQALETGRAWRRLVSRQSGQVVWNVSHVSTHAAWKP
jgi:hypothetical protein